MTMALHRIDQNRDKRLESLAADAIARLPQDRQRLTRRLIVKVARVDAGFAVPAVDSAPAARVCDDSR
jgi:predicted Zn-dependent protease with MMP-like domain